MTMLFRVWPVLSMSDSSCIVLHACRHYFFVFGIRSLYYSRTLKQVMSDFLECYGYEANTHRRARLHTRTCTHLSTQTHVRTHRFTHTHAQTYTCSHTDIKWQGVLAMLLASWHLMTHPNHCDSRFNQLIQCGGVEQDSLLLPRSFLYHVPSLKVAAKMCVIVRYKVMIYVATR